MRGSRDLSCLARLGFRNRRDHLRRWRLCDSLRYGKRGYLSSRSYGLSSGFLIVPSKYPFEFGYDSLLVNQRWLQNRCARQRRLLSLRLFLKSWRRFICIFGPQYSTFDFGMRKDRGFPCEKSRSIKMAGRCLGNTKSGLNPHGRLGAAIDWLCCRYFERVVSCWW